MNKLIPVREAKAKFSAVIHSARYQKERFLVTKNDIPWAVIMGVEEYEDLIDQIDTMAEQLSPKFQQSLKKSMSEYKKGQVGTEADIHEILKSKTRS